MDISSNYTAPLTLPNGQVVPARGSVSVEAKAWSDMKDHVVVKAWFTEKKLNRGAEPEEPEKAPPPALDGMSDEELRTFLKDKGVTLDGRWKRETLMAEAKKVQASA